MVKWKSRVGQERGIGFPGQIPIFGVMTSWLQVENGDLVSSAVWGP